MLDVRRYHFVRKVQSMNTRISNFLHFALCTLVACIACVGLGRLGLAHYPPAGDANESARRAGEEAIILEAALAGELRGCCGKRATVPMFISVGGKDPTKSMLKRLSACGIRLQPASRRGDDRGLVIDPGSRKPAQVLSVNGVRWLDDTHVSLFTCWTSGELGWHSYRCYLTTDGVTWRIERREDFAIG